MTKGQSPHDSTLYNHQCSICHNTNYTSAINAMLTSGIKYSKIIDAFKDKVHITRHILIEHYHNHLDKALRIDLIQSIQSGKVKVHSTAKKLYGLIEEADEVYAVGKDILIKNMNDPAVVTKTINSLTRLMATQEKLLRFNASLLKQTDEDISKGLDLATISAELKKYETELTKRV